jgi:hypothetical protein
LYVNGQVLVFGVTDVDIGLVARINSGSYQEEAEHTEKKDSIQYMASMRKQI